MSLVDADTGEIVREDEYLEALASRIREEHRRTKDALHEAVDAYFVIGQCLQEARDAIASDPAFGAWFREQGFGFTQQWARVLREASKHEAELRALLQSQLASGKTSFNIEKAVKQLTASSGGTRSSRPSTVDVRGHDVEAPTPTEFPCIVIDPPWRYDNVATRGAAEDHYPTMSLDELAKLDIPKSDDAHMYLWVTNSFLREGFDLLDVWGFTYKTVLTWCKPSIGMGNYFRNNTEHVLFGVAGKLATQRNDVGTWFQAPKTKHSAKPESFYDLVESCSPGPYLEMFARRRRFGWHVWGNEA